MKKLFLLALSVISIGSNAQSLYFPPTTGTVWDTLSPSSLGWCQPRIDSLYNYLEARHSKGFMILKDGKIVLERYFGTFTTDSVHYWASAGKSLTAMNVGIAQQEGLLNINSTASTYLGNGWTVAPVNKENLITVKHLLTMTSGLDDAVSAPCTNEDTSTACLQYLADAGTRWAYHTGAYRKLQKVVSNVSGTGYTAFTNNRIGTHIGMSGAWFNGVYFSKMRGMARYGLLALNKGVWDTDTILNDTEYFAAMTQTSQNFNLSNGYLWWLNGQASVMVPGLQTVIHQQLFPDAPADLFAALGKNDQKIYVVPSKNMVVVRFGDAAYTSQLAFSDFDNELWLYIDSLDYGCDPTAAIEREDKTTFRVYPNPAQNTLTLSGIDDASQKVELAIYNQVGQLLKTSENISTLDISGLDAGLYFIKIKQNGRVHLRSWGKE